MVNNFGKSGQQFWENCLKLHMVRCFVHIVFRILRPSISPYLGMAGPALGEKPPDFADFSMENTYVGFLSSVCHVVQIYFLFD